MPETTTRTRDTEIHRRIAEVGARLSSSFGLLIESLPDRPRKPQQLAEALGVNRNVSGRILAVAGAADPLAAVHAVPGIDPLRKAFRTARRRRAPDERVAEAEASIEEFARLVEELAGDRPAFDAIVSSLLPSARSRFELTAKHSLFRGASLLKGAAAETWIHTAIVHPSESDPATHDVAHIYGTLGLRRLRPAVEVKFSYRQFGTDRSPLFGLDGEPFTSASVDALDEFCSLPPGRLRVDASDSGAVLVLEGTRIGPDSAVDKLIGELRPAAMGRSASPGKRRKSLFVAPVIPVKTLVFDVFLHEEAYAAAEPSLVVYDTAVEGMASVNDPSRDSDRLDVQEQIVVLGRHPKNFPIPELPGYVGMLRGACDRLGWDPGTLRGYRCRVQYPMHGSQTCMVFEL